VAETAWIIAKAVALRVGRWRGISERRNGPLFSWLVENSFLGKNREGGTHPRWTVMFRRGSSLDISTYTLCQTNRCSFMGNFLTIAAHAGVGTIEMGEASGFEAQRPQSQYCSVISGEFFLVRKND
jgi:hypothetical protein